MILFTFILSFLTYSSNKCSKHPNLRSKGDLEKSICVVCSSFYSKLESQKNDENCQNCVNNKRTSLWRREKKRQNALWSMRNQIFFDHELDKSRPSFLCEKKEPVDLKCWFFWICGDAQG